MTAEISTRQDLKLLSANQTNNSASTKKMGLEEKQTYTLIYFDIRGRAETIRLLFALADVSYTDKRISKMDWPTLKSTMPFGQLPVLEISGNGMKSQTINQTHSIMRHVAREFGLDGRSSADKAKADIIVETMRECIEPIATIFNETDENKRAKVLTEYSEDLLPRFLDYLTDNLNDEWFLDQIGIADVAIYVAFDNISMFLPNFLDNNEYWKLREWRSRFESHPQISEWLANRPVTPY